MTPPKPINFQEYMTDTWDVGPKSYMLRVVEGGSAVLDATRRLLVVTMLAVGVIGLMPVLPLVFGYYSAAVTNDGTNTYTPQVTNSRNTIIECVQVAGATRLNRSTTYTNRNFFQCTNRWYSPVTLSSIILTSGNTVISTFSASTNVVIAAGGYACVTATLRTGNSARTRTVGYRGEVTGTNLRGQFDFTASVTTVNSGATPTYCQ